MNRRNFIEMAGVGGLMMLFNRGSGRGSVMEGTPASADITKYGEASGVGPMARGKTITLPNGVSYGYMTEAELKSGVQGGNRIFISTDGSRWFNTNFNDMSPDGTLGRPGLGVIEGVLGKSGKAYFLVVPASSSGDEEFPVAPVIPSFGKKGEAYRDRLHGFLRKPDQMEIEVADGTPDLAFQANFPGMNQEQNKARLLQVAR